MRMLRLLTSAAVIAATHAGLVLGADGTGTGLRGKYFANETLSGVPAVTRIDARVDYDWAGGSPAAAIPFDSYSVRWEGFIQPRFSESYTLTARTDDGVRLWIDNQLVIDSWILRGQADSTYVLNAIAGRQYRIRMDYFEHTGRSVARLLWQSTSEPKAPVPSSQLYPNTETGGAILTAEAPSSTFFSPASVSGYQVTSLPTVSAAGNSVTTGILGPNRWFANVPLILGTATSLTIQEGAQTLSKNVTWNAFPLDNAPTPSLNARLGDTLGVSAAAGLVDVGNPSGVHSTLVTGSSGSSVWLTAPGTWTFALPGKAIALRVIVFDGAFKTQASAPMAIETGVKYTLAYSSFPFLQSPASIHIVSEDYNLGINQSVTNLTLKALASGDTYASLRLESDTGPILNAFKITAFTLAGWEGRYVYPDGSVPPFIDNNAGHLYGITDLATGQSRLRVPVTMTPFVQNVKIYVSKFAHPTSFLGGATKFTITTDGAASSLGEPGFTASVNGSGQSKGAFSFSMLSGPNAPATYCLHHYCETTFSIFNTTVVASSIPSGLSMLHGSR